MITRALGEVITTAADGTYTMRTTSFEHRFLARLQIVVPGTDGINATTVMKVVDVESGYELMSETIAASEMFPDPTVGSHGRLWQAKGPVEIRFSGAGSAKKATVKYWLSTDKLI